MWRRLNDSEVIYRKTAAEYFNLVLECIDSRFSIETTNAMLLALALDPTLATTVFTHDIESFSADLDMECERISGRLAVRCAGLLEVSENGAVTFIHRSAQEFLVNTPEGQHIREADQLPSETRLFNLMRGLLSCIGLVIDSRFRTNHPKLPSRILKFCKQLGYVATNAVSFLTSAYETFAIQESLCSDNANEFLHLAEALYSAGNWTFDNFYHLRPDFLGAISHTGFYFQVLSGMAQLTSEAPAGMRVSSLYKSYIFESALESLKWRPSDLPGRDLASLCSLNDTSSPRTTYHGTIKHVQSMVGTIGEQDPLFYLTSDHLAVLLGASIDGDIVQTSESLGLVIRLLEEATICPTAQSYYSKLPHAIFLGCSQPNSLTIQNSCQGEPCSLKPIPPFFLPSA